MRSRRLTGEVENQSIMRNALKKHFFEIFFLQLLHNLSLSISHRLTWLERINLILLFYFSLIFHSWDSMHSFCRLAIYSSLWQYKRCTLTHMEFRPLISILSVEYWYILYIFIFIHLQKKTAVFVTSYIRSRITKVKSSRVRQWLQKTLLFCNSLDSKKTLHKSHLFLYQPQSLKVSSAVTVRAA